MMDTNRSARILVVDDDDDVRSFLVHALEALGHNCGTAPNGPAALEELGAGDYDLVLIDFAMPAMSGAELADAIRERKPGQRLLMISGYAGTSVVASAARDTPVIAKPVDLDTLDSAINRSLA